MLYDIENMQVEGVGGSKKSYKNTSTMDGSLIARDGNLPEKVG